MVKCSSGTSPEDHKGGEDSNLEGAGQFQGFLHIIGLGYREVKLASERDIYSRVVGALVHTEMK